MNHSPIRRNIGGDPLWGGSPHHLRPEPTARRRWPRAKHRADVDEAWSFLLHLAGGPHPRTHSKSIPGLPLRQPSLHNVHLGPGRERVFVVSPPTSIAPLDIDVDSRARWGFPRQSRLHGAVPGSVTLLEP